MCKHKSTENALSQSRPCAKISTMSDNRSSVVSLSRRIALAPPNSAGRDVAEYNLECKHSLQRLRLACRSGAQLIPILATRYGWARPGRACLWTEILNPL